MSTNHTRCAAAWREAREMPQPWHLTFCRHSLCLLWEVKELHRNFRAILNRASESGLCKLDALKIPVGSCETWAVVSFNNVLSKHPYYKIYYILGSSTQVLQFTDNLRLFFHPEDGDNTFLRDAGKPQNHTSYWLHYYPKQIWLSVSVMHFALWRIKKSMMWCPNVSVVWGRIKTSKTFSWCGWWLMGWLTDQLTN